MKIGTSNDTTDNNPEPFKIENDGNIAVNITVNASALWTTVNMNTSYYQFKANYSDEQGTFDYANSETSWVNMTNTSKKAVSILNHTNTNDTVAIDIRVQIPLNEEYRIGRGKSRNSGAK